MRKFIYSFFFILFTVLSVNSANWYVSTTGDDTSGDGSAGNPFATLNKAYDSSASGDIIYVGAGTFTNTGTISIAKNITIQGVSAGESIVQMDANPASSSNIFNKRMFAITASYSIILNDLTLQNAGGWNTNNGGGVLNSVNANTSITINRCNILNSSFRWGGAIQMNNATASLTISDSYFANNYALSRFDGTQYTDAGYGGGAINAYKGTMTLKNVVFYKNGNLDNPEGYATPATSLYGSCLKIDCNSTLVNCTFIDNGSDFSTIASQCVKIGYQLSPTIKLLNNIFIDNARLSAGDDDLYINPILDVSNVKNNVIAFASGADITANNSINNSFTKASSEINVVMDGSDPMVIATSTGVKYVEAIGTEIVEKGIGSGTDSDVPTTDIGGATRSTTMPWLGAIEEISTRIRKNDNSSYLNVFASGRRINIISTEIMSYAIYSVDGKIVKSSNKVQGINSYEVSETGIYFIKVDSPSGTKNFKVLTL